MSLTGIRVGDVGHGVVGNHPPAKWRLVGKWAGGLWQLARVTDGKRPAPPAEYVTWDVVERLMRDKQ